MLTRHGQELCAARCAPPQLAHVEGHQDGTTGRSGTRRHGTSELASDVRQLREDGASRARPPVVLGQMGHGGAPGGLRLVVRTRQTCEIALPTPVVGVASRISGGKSTDSAGVRYAYRLFWCRDGQADGTSGSRVSVLTRHGQELCAARCVAAPLAPFEGLSYVPTVRRAGRRHAQRGVRERPPGPQFS